MAFFYGLEWYCMWFLWSIVKTCCCCCTVGNDGWFELQSYYTQNICVGNLEEMSQALYVSFSIYFPLFYISKHIILFHNCYDSVSNTGYSWASSLLVRFTVLCPSYLAHIDFVTPKIFIGLKVLQNLENGRTGGCINGLPTKENYFQMVNNTLFTST